MSTEKNDQSRSASAAPRIWQRMPDAVLASLITAAASIVVALITILAGFVQFGRGEVASSPGPTVTVTEVRSALPGPVESSADAAQPEAANIRYLTDLDPAQESSGIFGSDWKNAPETIDGHDYQQGMVTTDQASETDCTATRDYALSRQYSRLRAVVGFADDSQDTTPATFKVLLDGKTVRSATVQLGRTVTLNQDLRGAVRLGFFVDTNCRAVSVALGDPRLDS
ncbi:MAG TPA: NPCBM/NEW2 domain-containing protein [Streptosporangiaceae bacterium]